MCSLVGLLSVPLALDRGVASLLSASLSSAAVTVSSGSRLIKRSIYYCTIHSCIFFLKTPCFSIIAFSEYRIWKGYKFLFGLLYRV